MSFGGVSNPRQKGWPKSFSITRIVAPPHNHSCGHCLKKTSHPKKRKPVKTVFCWSSACCCCCCCCCCCRNNLLDTPRWQKTHGFSHSRHSPKHPIHRLRFDKWTVAPRRLLVVITWGPLRYVPRPEGIWRCWMMLSSQAKIVLFFCSIFFGGGDWMVTLLVVLVVSFFSRYAWIV